MDSWNSVPLEVLYEIFGWFSFISWSTCFYPQLILNFCRKSVVGLSFDFALLNLTKHSSYMIYNVCLYFSPAIQKQYYEKYGYKELIVGGYHHAWFLDWTYDIDKIDEQAFPMMIPVAANDVAFSLHAVLLTSIALVQIAIYERGTQKISKISMAIVAAVWLFAGVCFFIALPRHSWLWLISIFSSIQVFMTIIKYIPQVVMNFRLKSTEGFSITYILLDFLGGMSSYGQMAMQSIDQNSLVNFYGNIGKTLLSLVSIFFDLLFMCQHFILYPANKVQTTPKVSKDMEEPLIFDSL